MKTPAHVLGVVFFSVPLVLFLGCSSSGNGTMDGGDGGGDGRADGDGGPDGRPDGGDGGGGVEVLASGFINAYHLAVDSTSVYWTETVDGQDANQGRTEVWKVGLAGGPATRIFQETGQPNYVAAWSIAVDTSAVYWTDSNQRAQSLRRVGLVGGPAEVLATAPDRYPNALALDGTTVFFTDAAHGPEGGAVRALSMGGGGWDLATGLTEPWAIAVSETYVYWTDTWDGVIRRAPKGGGGPVEIAAGVSTAYQDGNGVMAVDGTGVYFIGGGEWAEEIRRVGLGGGAVTMLASAPGAVALALDATHVYWTSASGAIQRVSKQGGGAERVPVTGSPAALALDAGFVYWVDGSSVRRLPKW